MEIITDYKRKKEWNDFVAANSYPASFLQSWEWGEFNQKILGNESQRWAVIDGQELKIGFSLIKKKLAAGKHYYYCPRGLIWRKNYYDQRIKAYPKIINELKQKTKQATFIRVCPVSKFQEYIFGFLKRLGFIEPKILLHSKEPEKTLVLDLNKPENELLAEMHHKTRYNIRLAEKKGVKIRIGNNESRVKDIDIFYTLCQETAARDGIQIYSKDYYAKLIKYFSENNLEVKLRLYIAECNNKPLSGALVLYFGNTATYLYGASSNEGRNLMPNYLMQWMAIKEAKQAAMEIYDFWGINEQNKDWAGITRFKKGFGGQTITFMGSWDYVLDNKWYNIFRILRLIKKLIP